MKKVLFALFFGLFLCTNICYAQTVQTNLEIDEYKTIKSATTGFLGINDTWRAGRLYTDSSMELTLSDKYKNAVHSFGVPLNQVRMAGADAHSFNWKDSLGPLEERANGSNLGLVEWIKFNKELNPDVSLTFTINIIEDTIKDHKDLIRFLLLKPDDANAVDEDGFNWAQYRVDLGIKEPVNIKLFELGNEVYYDYVEACAQKVTAPTEDVIAGVEKYISDCKEIINAMKGVKSDIAFSAVTFSYSQATRDNARAWNSRIVAELYRDCAYFTHHEYYFDYNFYWITLRLKERLLDYIDALPVADSEKPHVYISEYGYWMDKSLDNKRDGTCLSGTLTMAKYLNFIINTPRVELANVHVTNEGISSDEYWHSGWDLFRYYDDGKIYSTVPTEMFKIFNMALENNTENEVISAKLSADDHNYWANYLSYPNGENTEKGLLNVSAFKTNDGGINLLFVNSSADVEHELNISYKNASLSGKKYKLAEKAILTSEQLTDNNLPDSDNLVYVKRYIENNNDEFKDCTVPAKSILLLKLIPLNNTYAKETIKFVGEHKESGDNVQVGKNFGIQMPLYENADESAASNMDLYIIKDTVSPDKFIESPGAYMDDIVYMGSSEVKRNYVYYDVVMPDNTADGGFYAIVGNLQKNLYSIADFYYSKDEKSISDIRVEAISKRTDKDSYSLTYSAAANFEDVPVVVKVYKKSGAGMVEQGIVHIGRVMAENKINKQIEIPAGSVAGEYTIELMWEDRGNMKSVTQDFNFEKIDELVSIFELPTNEKNEIITLENISSAEKLFVTLKNNTPNPVNVFAVVAEYDGASDSLVSANVGRKELMSNADSTTMEISLEGIKPVETGGYIKIFVWRDDSVSPLTNVTYVK